ncbi:MAG: hypothetical protein P8Z70_10745 [Desulfuromonadales bacterium]
MTVLVLSGFRKNSANVWVSRVLSAYGGEKALRRVESVVYRGEIEATMRRDRGREVIYFQRPRRLRVNLEYSRSREERVLNGSRGWRNSGGASVRYRVLPWRPWPSNTTISTCRWG